MSGQLLISCFLADFSSFPMMPEIFISYRREDSQTEANLLKLALEQRLGEGCAFLDTREIQPGDHWPSELQEAAQSAKVMCVLIGPKWLFAQDKKSGERRLSNPEDWVRREVATGLSQAHTLVIPLLLQGAKIPEPEILPEPLKSLPEQQHYEIRPNEWDAALRKVLAVIEKKIPPATPFRRVSPGFLEAERQKSFKPEDFFGALPIAQWWGITNDYYAEVHLMSDLLSRVQERLDNPQALVAGIICGTGGMGKTTLAREVARRLVPDVQVWWLDAEEQEYLIETDDPFGHFDTVGYKHVVVLDDWGKFVDAKALNKCLTQCSKKYPNIKFLITARQPNAIEKKDPGCLFRLDTDTHGEADMAALYEKFASKFSHSGEDAFLSKLPHPAAFDKPFHFLFVALRLRDLQRNARQQLFASGSNYEVYFYEIVKSDILRLAESPRTHGLAVSLVGYALLFYHLRIAISVQAFLGITRLGKTDSAGPAYLEHRPVEQWDIAAHYLSQYEYEEDKYKKTPNKLAFKKDDFYETIFQLAEQEQNEEIVSLFHPQDLPDLCKYLIQHADSYTTSRLYYFSCQQKPDWLNESEKEQYFNSLLEKGNGHHAYMQTAFFDNVRLPFMTDAIVESLIPRFLEIAPGNVFLSRRIVHWAKSRYKGAHLRERLQAYKTSGLIEIVEYQLSFLNSYNGLEAVEQAKTCSKMVNQIIISNAGVWRF
ncbi:MAG: toll/interleukin-1 receptor domain-containing protein [Lewinellaceae bacterium]|nr:toll/interleukin-1 receptor domain-containing protein [Lewinellaceae bacterium]